MKLLIFSLILITSANSYLRDTIYFDLKYTEGAGYISPEPHDGTWKEEISKMRDTLDGSISIEIYNGVIEVIEKDIPFDQFNTHPDPGYVDRSRLKIFQFISYLNNYTMAMQLNTRDQKHFIVDSASVGDTLKIYQIVFIDNALNYVIQSMGIAVIREARLYGKERFADSLRIADSLRVLDSIRVVDGLRVADSLRVVDSLRVADSIRIADSLSTSIIFRPNKVGFVIKNRNYDVLGRMLFRKE